MSSKGEHGRHARPTDRANDSSRDKPAVLDRIERTSGGGDADVAELVRAAQSNDDLAFAELYIRFFDRVHRYLLIALKNPDDAQEVAQDVFARALRTLDSFDPGRGDFRNWLFGLVRNQAIDHLRRGSRTDELALHTLPSTSLPMAERAASLLESLDPDSGVRSMIGHLPETQRRVLALRFVFGLDTLEIADVLDSTPDAVRHAQHRALKALAVDMTRDDEPDLIPG